MTTHAGRLPRASAKARALGGRTADRAARHVFRSRRVWPALVAALLLTVGGVLAAIEALSALADRPAHIVAYERVTGWADDTAWKDWPALALASGVALVGLIFLLAGLLPGRSGIVPLHGSDPDLLTGVNRRGLKGAVAAAAAGVDGVRRVRRVRLGRHRIRVTAETVLHSAEGLEEEVGGVVRARLDQLEPLPRRAVAVRIAHRKA